MSYDAYGNIVDPVLSSTKKLADIEIDADKRPSSCRRHTLPRDGQFFDAFLQVGGLGALKIALEADEATGRLFPVGMALSARELPKE